jgi:hypothetical protein
MPPGVKEFLGRMVKALPRVCALAVALAPKERAVSVVYGTLQPIKIED